MGCALAHGINGIGDCCIAGDHDHIGFRRKLGDLFNKSETIHLVHFQIGDHHVKMVAAFNLLQGLDSVTGNLCGMAQILEVMLHVVTGDLFVINDQYS